MMIINIAEVLKIHEISASNHANLIVLAPSLVVLMIWVLIMLPWGLRNIIPAQKDGKFGKFSFSLKSYKATDVEIVHG